MQSNTAVKVLRVVNTRESRAAQRYSRQYDNSLYCAARTGDGEHDNMLLDEAMALCGHPAYQMRHRERGIEEYAFLARFLPAS